MFKVIESKDEFIAAARAGLLWANYMEDSGVADWQQAPWGHISSSFLCAVWDKAGENSRKASPNMHEWRLHDFAVLVEDDGEEEDED